MYLPPAFREDRIEHLSALMRDYPLATVVTSEGGKLVASHIPLLYEPSAESPGILRGHLARANDQWQDFRPEAEALAIFHGPQAYISPSWYATKQKSGRVVPTWNYAVVHAHGSVEVYTEPERLRKYLDTLTAEHEKSFAQPWGLKDAPAEFIDGLLGAIVGIDIRISRLEGKWKASQNRPAEDREGVVDGLGEGNAMADLVRERSPKE